MNPYTNAGALRRAGPLLGFLAALLLLAANMRTGIVVIGPLADTIGDALRLSGAALGVLTTLPLLCFGLLSSLAPRLGEHLGLERSLLLALWVLVAGLALRALGGYSLMVIGTAILGAAIAVMNVLTPGLVRLRFPHRIALITSLYSVVMGLGATSAAAFAVPVRDAFGGDWRVPLAVCALLALVAALAWLPLVRYKPVRRAVGVPSLALWRVPQAWILSVFFGSQSLVFYSLTAWLAKMFIDVGTGDGHAAFLLTVMTLCGPPASFVAPLLLVSMRRRRAMVLLHLPLVVGLIGLVVAPLAAPLSWAVLIGLGQGAMISVGLTLISLRGADARVSAGLSGMCQSLGYLLACTGPVTLGALHDLFGQWQGPLAALLVVLTVQLVAGVVAADGAPIQGAGARSPRI